MRKAIKKARTWTERPTFRTLFTQAHLLCNVGVCFPASLAKYTERCALPSHLPSTREVLEYLYVKKERYKHRGKNGVFSKRHPVLRVCDCRTLNAFFFLVNAG